MMIDIVSEQVHAGGHAPAPLPKGTTVQLSDYGSDGSDVELLLECDEDGAPLEFSRCSNIKDTVTHATHVA